MVDLHGRMVAFYLSATVVTLLQYLRLRERRLLPLTALFALTAAAHFAAEYVWIANLFDVTAVGAGLVLLYMLSPRHPAAR